MALYLSNTWAQTLPMEENDQMTSENNGIWLERRFIPFPTSVSPEAQKASRLAAAINHDTMRPEAFAIPLEDAEGWAKARSAATAFMGQLFAPLMASVRSTIENHDMDGTVVHVATPRDPVHRDRVYLDIHGGAFVTGDGAFCRLGAGLSADLHGIRCYAVDYRMPAEGPFPAGLDDCIHVYRALIDQYGARNVAVGGTSAGGNLAAALVLRARDEGLPLPASLMLGTPEVDLTESGDSFTTNLNLDWTLPTSLMVMNLAYANGADLKHPYLSPLFGDFTRGFPPTFLHCGTRDLFLSNTVRMHRALRRAGVPTELHVFEGMPHGGFFGAPEDVELALEKARFVAEHWK